MKVPLDWKRLRLAGLAGSGAGAPQLVAAVNVTLLLLLVYNAAVLSWRLVPAVESEPPPVVAVSGISQQAAPASGGWNIARWSLFGKESRAVAPTIAPKEIPKTNLKLTLRGVFVAGGGGGAIIAEANGKEQYYAVNSRLPGGATLKEVHPSNVVLLRHNRALETLELPRESVNFRATSSSVQPGRSSRRGAGARGEINLKQYRRDLMREPQRLTDAIKMHPHSDKGGFIGYKVNPGRDRALFDRVGLMPGDIVTAVNGVQLDTPAKGLNVMRILQTANSVRLDVQRNGRSQTFDVSID